MDEQLPQQSKDRMDPEACIEILSELIFEHGKVVFSNFCLVWDGIGSGANQVFDFADHYWAVPQESSPVGPFTDLVEAIIASEGHLIGGCSETTIDSKEITPEDLVPLLEFDYLGDEPFMFTINRQKWRATVDGKIERVSRARVTRPKED